MKMTATERMRKKFERAVPGVGRFCAKGVSTDMELVADKRSFWSWVSTTDVDEEGDVVVPSGADTKYFPGPKRSGLGDDDTGVPTVYLNHNYNDLDHVIGKCRRMRAMPRGLRALTYIADTERGDQVLSLIREGIIRGMSIGFRTVEAGPPSDEEKAKYGEGCTRVVRTCNLVEYSITAMPMNVGASIDIVTAKSLASTDILRSLGMDIEPKRLVVPLPPKIVVAPRVVRVG